MKPLNRMEVIDVMKKEVPMLLNKRILELEYAISVALSDGDFTPERKKWLAGIFKKGVSL